jgi:hypothetical protein
LFLTQGLLLLYPSLQQVQLREDALQIQLYLIDVVVRAPGSTLPATKRHQQQHAAAARA